jgi:AcrR family transcriptional regulator
MTARINRKELIIDTASKLFVKQGYEATSVRQIADAVGVTEAALYYHFKDGKRELLQAVFACQMPNFKQILDDCTASESLNDLLHRYGKAITRIAPQMTPRISWLISEFPNLGEEERNLIHLKLIAFQDGLANLINPFVTDDARAKTIAWTLICATLGHNQLFTSLEMQSLVDFEFMSLIDNIAKSLA